MSGRIEKFLSENKFPLIIVCGLLLMAPLVYGLMRHSAEKQATEYNNKIYRFRADVFEKYREKALAPAEFASQLRQLKGDVENHRGLYPFLLNFADEMIQHEDWKEAEEILLWGKEKYTQGHLLGDLFRLRLATIYEDTGRPKKAVDILLQLTSNNQTPLLLDKLYLDLSRLYLSLGDEGKAKSGLDYVIENSQESELLRLAKLMKEELANP